MAVIMVVEDEPDISELIGTILRQLHHEARLVVTAAEALRMAQTARFDAILLDIFLPDATGTATLDQLRKLCPDVPIIMVTANVDGKLARETLKHGAFDYIVKPFDFDRLKTVLAAALAG